MRRSAMIGAFFSAALAWGMGIIGMPVTIKTDPEPWLPTRAKSKASKVRYYEGGPIVKPPMNGKREVARRLRQIENGQLTRGERPADAGGARAAGGGA